jgi:hypothetical protein
MNGFVSVHFAFPLEGLNENWGLSYQSTTTSPDLNNVRPYDVLDTRARGGQRPGLEQQYETNIGGTNKNPVVFLTGITLIEEPKFIWE